jgi:hypothetical protein
MLKIYPEQAVFVPKSELYTGFYLEKKNGGKVIS